MENIDHLVTKLRQLDHDKAKLVAKSEKQLDKEKQDLARRVRKTHPGVADNLLQMALIIIVGLIAMIGCWYLKLG